MTDRYLPEMLNGKRLLVPQKEAGKYMVDNSEIQSEARGVGYRKSTQLDDRDSGVCAFYGKAIQGEFSDGWLKVRLGDVGTEFSLQVEREEGKELGVRCKKMSDGCVFLKRVNTTGVFAAWNEAHPELPVEDGDILTSVNGEEGEGMYDELDAFGLLDMTVKKGVQEVLRKGPFADLEMPEFKVSMFVPLLLMQGLSWANVDLVELGYTQHIQIMFACTTCFRLILQAILYLKIQAVESEGVVKVPAEMQFGSEVSPALELTPRAYDMTKWTENFKELSIGTAITCGIYFKWETLSALLLTSAMAGMNIFEMPLVKVHLLGWELARPYGAKADKKKAE